MEKVLTAVILFFCLSNSMNAQNPDVMSIPADLVNPRVTEGKPSPGTVVLQYLPEYSGTEVAHSVYLPVNWSPKKRYSVIVEYLGNSCRVKENRPNGLRNMRR